MSSPSGARAGPLERVQAVSVARRYFLDGRTKSEIAADFAISRFKVARLIDAAVKTGLVRFVIADPDEIDAKLSEAIRARYGLRHALVLSGPDLPSMELTRPLGRLAAGMLPELLQDGELLGVAWGRTLAAAAEAVTHLPRVDVMQAAGSLAGIEYPQSALDLVHRLAAASGGHAYAFHAPMWAEDGLLVDRLRQEPTVASALARLDSLDAMVVGIGSWAPPISCLHATFPTAWREAALARGAQADLCATLIDAEGAEVATPLTAHGLALDSRQMRKIPQVIGVAGGAEKLAAIRAVLRGRWITSLVTDGGVARGLLK